MACLHPSLLLAAPLSSAPPAAFWRPDTRPSAQLQSPRRGTTKAEVERAQQLGLSGTRGWWRRCSSPFSKGQRSDAREVIQHCSHREREGPRETEQTAPLLRVTDSRPLAKDICGLVLAANYFGVKGLLDDTCRAIADVSEGKTPLETHLPRPSDATEDGEARATENQLGGTGPGAAALLCSKPATRGKQATNAAAKHLCWQNPALAAAAVSVRITTLRLIPKPALA